jgi:polygalacturonase
MRHSFNIAVRMIAVLVGGALAGSAQLQNPIAEEVKAHCADLPFKMPEIKVPTFPDRRTSIVDYGAIGDGYTMNTRAFADAIQACVKAGGGTVVVPPGTWLTGPIRIESNVNLHLERGALVQFSKRIEDFPLIAGLDGKSKRYVITPPIHAYRANNIAITGEGIIDGAGEVWRYVKREKQTEREWKDLVASAGVVSPDGKEWWPSKEAIEGEEYLKRIEQSGKEPTAADYAHVREFLRPDLVQLVQCDGILLDGPTFRNSPRFHVRPAQSENIIVRNIKIFSPWYAQNGDGLDPTSCRNVVIYNILVDTGDDGICLKPGTIAKSQKSGPACENIVIADCVVYHAHGGFVIGSESFGGVNNVSVRNCLFIGTDVGVRFKSLRGKGGLVENVFIEGIQMREIANEAILFDMYYGGGAPEVEAMKDLTLRKAEPVTSQTPRFQNFSVKNVVCNGANRAIVINGLPEMPIRNITLDNVSVSAKQGFFCADAEGIQLKGCRIVPQFGPVMTLIQSRSVTVQGGSYPVPANVFLKVDGEKSEHIRLVGINLPKFENAVVLGQNVKRDAVIRD